MSATVLLEWNFTPPDYFEEAIAILRHDYAMNIADGKVEAKIESSIFTSNSSIRQALHDSLNDRFLGVQLLTHRPYELSKSTITRVHPDGRREMSIELESACFVISGGSVDFQVTDKDGNVIADSKRDRIERKKSLAELVSAHRASDGLLGAMLRSYDAGVRDPNNELVHLYEIRDALSVKFGGEGSARAALAITASQWSRLGQLCNNEPLCQGRHRGKTGEVLRDATEAELAEARGIARAMIEAYLQYIDPQNLQGSS
ncbi:putative ferric uptake regulation protein [Candidatus Propionivibrio aalborgensis]|uniref:Putative ferric uptake regulation protein n=1 Tax=Candidatus Propionivibrio aalborgensis TaxID=1860101 RepID=A0A1A8XTE8_9RHOO|nr:hypothetical protein [Candidatus Propionivibrio aalborgensis]SBT08345.1 putative ferric uptake regulation protein [Candidatus Propionivibrio aalborgensis]